MLSQFHLFLGLDFPEDLGIADPDFRWFSRQERFFDLHMNQSGPADHRRSVALMFYQKKEISPAVHGLSTLGVKGNDSQLNQDPLH